MCVFKKYYLNILHYGHFMCIQYVPFMYYLKNIIYIPFNRCLLYVFNNKFQIAPVVVISGKTCSVSVNNLDTGCATYEYITLPSLSSTIV